MAMLLASVAALAALDLQLTPDGVAPLVVLELGARGVLVGPAGFRCGGLPPGGRSRGSFDPRAPLLGSTQGPFGVGAPFLHGARRGVHC